MSTTELSTGSVKGLVNAEPGDNDLWEADHVLQLASVKKIGPAREGQGPDRYRIVLSDGVNYTQSMLATQLNHLVEDGELKKNTIVKVEKLTCNMVQGKRCVDEHALLM